MFKFLKSKSHVNTSSLINEYYSVDELVKLLTKVKFEKNIGYCYILLEQHVHDGIMTHKVVSESDILSCKIKKEGRGSMSSDTWNIYDYRWGTKAFQDSSDILTKFGRQLTERDTDRFCLDNAVSDKSRESYREDLENSSSLARELSITLK